MNDQPIDATAPAIRQLPEKEPIAPERPRVWTVFAAVVIAVLLAILFQAILGVLLVIIELSRGVQPAELGKVIVDRLVSPYVFILMMAKGQLAFGIASILPAWFSPVPFRKRVAWVRARPSWHVYPIVMLGSIVPLAIGLTSAIMLAKVIPADESFLKFFERVTIDSAIVFVVFVGIAPGFFEELLFRGYMQQRLVQRWGPTLGIVVTSIVFGLVHLAPHSVAAAMPLGFWFGYVAWRSGSILPAMLCHFFVNSGLNAWRMIIKFGDVSETGQHVVHLCLLLIGIICFAVCFWPPYWRERVSSTNVVL